MKTHRYVKIIITLLIYLICSGCSNSDYLERSDFTTDIETEITVISSTSVEFSWKIDILKPVEFEILKNIGDSLVTTFNVSEPEGSIIDDSIIPGITYNYVIYIHETYFFSDEASVNTLLPPSGLQVTVSDGAAIMLTWKDKDHLTGQYNIERKEANDPDFTLIDTLDTDSLIYMDFDLENKKQYFYRINTLIDGLITDYSNIDSTGFHKDGLFVPTDYSTIQEALETASPAEKVILEPGVYYERIIFPVKDITLCSRYVLDNDPSYIENTIIDGTNGNTGITFINVSKFNDLGKVKGLTFQNFTEAAIKCFDNKYPALSNLIIRNNNTKTYGALYFQSCTNHNISNLLIYNNSGNANGCAVSLSNADIKITNCTITGNSKCPIYSSNYSKLEVLNSILYSNYDYSIILNETNKYCLISYSDVEDGFNGIQNLSTGNLLLNNTIDLNPLFLYPAASDYHLQSNSPCIDTGEDLEIYLDFNGTRNDMGAYGGPNSNW